MKYTKLVSLLAGATMLLAFTGQAAAERHVRDRDNGRHSDRVQMSSKGHNRHAIQYVNHGSHYAKHDNGHHYGQYKHHRYGHAKKHWKHQGYKHWNHHARAHYAKPYRRYYKPRYYTPPRNSYRHHHDGINLILKF